MTTKTSTLFGTGLLFGVLLSALSAAATWPTGGVRTMPGQTCVYGIKVDTQPIWCPFISDSDTYYGGSNGTIYLDYHVSASGAGEVTYAAACRQSYTGSTLACGTASSTTGTGAHDLDVFGFDTISGTPTIYDYFYVSISTSETVDVVYGAGYQN